VGDVGEQRDPEHEEAEDRRHDDEHPTGIATLWWAEGRDSVRDRLEACQRRPAVGKGPQHDDDRGAVQKAAAGCADVHNPALLNRVGVQLTERGSDDSDDDQRSGRSGEKVRRKRERPARLADPAQVAVGEEGDDGHGDLEAPASQRRKGGGQRIGPRCCLNGDGHDVVDDQRDGGHLSHLHAEVVPGHDVRTAGSRVDHDDLSVRECHEEQHDDDRDGDRQQKAEGGDANGLHQLEKDLLSSVCSR
jgi:hypothetical protein